MQGSVLEKILCTLFICRERYCFKNHIQKNYSSCTFLNCKLSFWSDDVKFSLTYYVIEFKRPWEAFATVNLVNCEFWSA